MREELRVLLVELLGSIKNPAASNPDLPISAIFDKVFEYAGLAASVENLLKKGITQNDGKALLKYAIKNNNTLLIKYLKEEKITFNFMEVETELLHAIVNGETDIFKTILDLVDIDADINRQLKSTTWGSTIVGVAFFLGRDDIAKMLIGKGADLSIPDWLGTSNLSAAIVGNNIACLRLLPAIKKEDLFAENIYGFSPLHYAVRAFHLNNNSEMLDELCLKFDLEKNKILDDFKNYPKHRIMQSILVEKISRYMDIETSKNKAPVFLDKKAEGDFYTQTRSEAVKSGLCHGLSFIFGMHAVESQEDLKNFYDAVALLAAWDGKEESLSTPISATYFHDTFHTLGDLVKKFCNDAIYFFGQDSLSVIDTPPHDRKTQYNIVNSENRHITPIINISMQNMLEEEFTEILRDTLKPNTLLDLTGAAHTISIACNSNNEIYYFDPNHTYPTVKPIKNIEELSGLIYKTMPVNFGFQNSAPHYIGVYHVSDKKISDIQEKYPSKKEIFDKYILGTDRKNNLYNELELCVLQDNPDMLKYILKNKNIPDLSFKQSSELVQTALNKKSLRCLNVLVKFGNLNQNQINDLEKETSIINYKEILKTLKDQKSSFSQHAKLFKG